MGVSNALTGAILGSNNPLGTEHPHRLVENILPPCSVTAAELPFAGPDQGGQLNLSPADASATAGKALISSRGCGCCQQEGPFSLPQFSCLSLSWQAQSTT